MQQYLSSVPCFIPHKRYNYVDFNPCRVPILTVYYSEHEIFVLFHEVVLTLFWFNTSYSFTLHQIIMDTMYFNQASIEFFQNWMIFSICYLSIANISISPPLSCWSYQKVQYNGGKVLRKRGGTRGWRKRFPLR